MLWLEMLMEEKSDLFMLLLFVVLDSILRFVL